MANKNKHLVCALPVKADLEIRNQATVVEYLAHLIGRGTRTVTETIGFIVDAGTAASYIVAGMGFAVDGTLYGVEARTEALVTIDTATAQATPVGGGLGIDVLNYGGTVADGVFYLLNGNRVFGVSPYTVDLLNGNRVFGVSPYTVDLSTGAASFVGATGVRDNGIGLALDGDGGLVAVINDNLYEIDRLSGAATLVGNTGATALSSLEFVDLNAVCPCDRSWKNHGQYVSCVSRATRVLSPGKRGALVLQAAQNGLRQVENYMKEDACSHTRVPGG